VLSGKYAADPQQRASQPGRLTTTAWGRTLLSERNLDIAAQVREVASSAGRPAAQVALRWLLQRPGGVVPIVGARSAAQLGELLGATGFELDEAALATLEAASRIDPGYPKGLLDGPAGRRMVHGEHADGVVRTA
jgi:aryl-alcohol dehydrogenase-like predicted oxidoreductase